MRRPVLTVRVLLGRGVRLALGAQTEQETVKLQPTHPANASAGCAAGSFPRFPFSFFFSRLLRHRGHTQALPELPPAGRPRSPSLMDASRMSLQTRPPSLAQPGESLGRRGGQGGTFCLLSETGGGDTTAADAFCRGSPW